MDSTVIVNFCIAIYICLLSVNKCICTWTNDSYILLQKNLFLRTC